MEQAIVELRTLSAEIANEAQKQLDGLIQNGNLEHRTNFIALNAIKNKVDQRVEVLEKTLNDGQPSSEED